MPAPVPRSFWLPVAAIILVAALLRAATFSLYDISHADELMQYLEQGNRLATGHGIVPWEVRYGARNAIIPQLLAAPLWLGRALWPRTLGAVWLARGGYAALCGALTLAAAWRIGAGVSRPAALLALFAVAVWWESVLFDDLLLSESLAAPLLLLAAPALIAPGAGRRALAVAGLLLGLAVLVRFQMALFAGVLAATALRADRRRWGPVVAGALAAGVLGAASDLAGGRAPYGWVMENLAMNVGAQNRAARFGASPPWAYLAMMWAHMGPAAPFILAGAGWSALRLPRLRPLAWAALAHLAAHSLIAHKEFRFVWASEETLVLLAAIASASLSRGRGVALAAAGWLALTLLAGRTSGGATSLRGGGAIPRLGGAAAARAQTCGLLLPDEWRAHLVPALLPRQVPLTVAPPGALARPGAIPPAALAAANAAILPAAPGPGWRIDRCIAMPLGRACLIVRDGACTPAPGWSYQAALLRGDL